MPTSGTHITVVQRLASSSEFSQLVGSPDADPESEEGLKHKFAKLGAIGPDIFYAMMDYDQPLQDLANFLTAFAGSVECITELISDIEDKVSKVESDITFGVSDIFHDALGEFESTFGMIGKVFTNILLAELVDNGLNLFTIFQARRQQDEPRRKWFWADYLHYVRTGVFVKELFEKSRGNPNTSAFSYGYLSHYVTDVVGHPFINQVTGSVWRLYWQRHHMIENYVDAYMWPRWHDEYPKDIDPATGEQPLDTIRTSPNLDLTNGAPFTFARINDHINIGVVAGNDPINKYIRSVCDQIRGGLNNLGVIPPVPTAPEDKDLREWAEFMAATFKAAYPPSSVPPKNLDGDGYPQPDDILQAYSLLRLFLRFATEESVKEPEFPDILADVWKKVQDLIDHVIANLGQIPPLPSPGIALANGFSLDEIWNAIKDFTKWAINAAIALGKAAFDFIRDAIAVGGVLLLDSIRAGLYIIRKALFDLYKHFRFVLVRFGYAVPFTDEISDEVAGGVQGSSLWRTPNSDGLAPFPAEELPSLEREKLSSSYAPWVFPTHLPEMQEPHRALYERPLTWVGPYGANEPPDTFIDRPLGSRVMLSAAGPIRIEEVVKPGQEFVVPEDFGGAIANCEVAFRAVRDAISAGKIPTDLLPDYNLDGDRGYAWPCWNLAKAPGESDNPDLLTPIDGQEVIVDAIKIV